MSIVGSINTSQLLANTQFYLSGLTDTNLNTINITDVNGLDVSECYGITTKIITVNGDNITLTGDCNSSLEIKVTEGISRPVNCNYSGYSEQQDTGLVLFYYTGNSTSLNVHPVCCESLGYTPEIGPDKYYVCRWREVFCADCCESYIARNQYDGNGYMVFDVITGGTTTVVPKVECCQAIGLVDTIINGEIHCIQYVEPNPCEGLEVFGTPPVIGDVTFINPVTNETTLVVPSSQCCEFNGFSFRTVGTKFACYVSLGTPPTVSLEIADNCCEEVGTTSPCVEYSVFANQGSSVVANYIKCDGTSGSISVPQGDEAPICSTTYPSIISGNATITATGLPNCSTSTGNSILLRDCETGFNYNARRLSTRTYVIGEVIQYIPLVNSSLIRCGTIVSTTYPSGNEDATFGTTSAGTYACDDTLHCNVSNGAPI